ncbi:hypothetical protein E2562_028561 [Oryza meyeriana var. granulata]|uniref:Uncharacterized protein n=1 Tax=Oryza meyeriana var. granulata TaxID=110450 RepID=A0A6G1EQT4_9ORYZ|nr:hypothetical protein E2562_028561 [Oryza meyeriana var. granulata]
MEPEMRILRCPFTTMALRSYGTAAEAADASTNTGTTDATAKAAEEAMDECASGGPHPANRPRSVISAAQIHAKFEHHEVGGARVNNGNFGCCPATREEVVALLQVTAARGTPDWIGQADGLWPAAQHGLVARWGGEAAATFRVTGAALEVGLGEDLHAT